MGKYKRGSLGHEIETATYRYRHGDETDRIIIRSRVKRDKLKAIAMLKRFDEVDEEEK